MSNGLRQFLVIQMADIIKLDSNNIVSAIHGGFDLGKPYEHNIFLIEVHIAGTTHIDNIHELEPELTIGKRVKFYREPNNPYDEKAIVLRDEKGNKLGYIPRNKNEILSRLMDGGKLLYGTINSKENIDRWVKITIQVYLDD